MDVWLIKVPPSAKDAIEGLLGIVEQYSLQRGINNSLVSKLQNALNLLTIANTDQYEHAIKIIEAFINTCEAQIGKKLTIEQADNLIAEANAIIQLLQQQ